MAFKKLVTHKSGYDSSVVFSNGFIITNYRISGMRDSFHNDVVIKDYVDFNGEWITDNAYGISIKSDRASSFHISFNDDMMTNDM